MTALLASLHSTACYLIPLAAAVSFALAGIAIGLDIEIIWLRRKRRLAAHPYGVDVVELMRVAPAEGV